MYESQIPIAFDRLLVSIVPALETVARVGLASPTGNSILYPVDLEGTMEPRKAA